VEFGISHTVGSQPWTIRD